MHLSSIKEKNAHRWGVKTVAFNVTPANAGVSIEWNHDEIPSSV